MKYSKLIKTIVLLCFMFAVYTLIAQQTPICENGYVVLEPVNSYENFEHGNWVLVFEDNFDGVIDFNKWYTCFGGWNRKNGDELQYYLDANVYTENGILKLQAKREPDNYPVIYFDSQGVAHYSSEYFEYTSGMLQTKSLFQYGLFEIRCKIPQGQGLWPAFWLYGNGGEIDIFEFNSSYPKKHYMTIHTWPDNGSGNHEYCASDWNSNSSFSDGFHTFSLEWDEYKLVFRVDGVVKRIDYKYFDVLGHGLYDCYHQTNGIYEENLLFPKHAQALIMNLAIANDNTSTFGPAPNAQTPFPSTLEVDYVRVYKKMNPSKNLSIYDFDEKGSDYYTGRTITIAGGGSHPKVNNRETKNLIACENVVLSPGFTAEEGCSFEAKVLQRTELQPQVNANGGISATENETTPDYVKKEEGLEEKINDSKGGSGWSDEIRNNLLSSSASSSTSIKLFEVYPNPNKGSFQIRLNSDTRQYQCVQVVDPTGVLIYSIDYPTSPILNVTIGDRVGVYFVKCLANSHTEIIKVVVQ